MKKLKSTGQKCFEVGYIGTDRQPWGADYRRVCILGKTNSIQIVHKNKLID